MSSSLAGGETDSAFERLYRRHRGDVYRFVLRDVRSPEEAEDVTQTAFLNAFRALQRGDRPERPRAWLLTIAQNVARRRFRARALRPQEVELDPELPAAHAPEGPTGAEIRRALQRLRPSHRTVLVLREIGGLSYAEVAETLGLSLSAVETLIFRARRALREELTREERPGLRVGGILLPLPAALGDRLGWLGGWVGRQAATAKLAGALGAAVLGIGVAVELGTLALPGRASDTSVEVEVMTFAPAADASAARPREWAAKDRGDRPAKHATAKRSPSGGKPAAAVSVLQGATVPEVDLPAVSVPGVTVPALELPPPPEVTVPLPDEVSPSLPEVTPPQLPDVTPPPLPEVTTPPLPVEVAPSLPEAAVPSLPEVAVPPLPDAGEPLP